MTLQMMSLCHKHEPPNIQMQRTGLYIMLLGIRNLPAADLGRSKDEQNPLATPRKHT